MIDRAVWMKLTAVCGTLDIVYAAVAASTRGEDVAAMLRAIAAGPFGDAALGWGAGSVALGLLVHFAIMAVIVATGLALLSRQPLIDIKAWKTGTLYGLVVYCVMYGLILQARFGTPFPDHDRVRLAIGLLPHVVLVGIPVALGAQGRLFSRKPGFS